MAKLDSLPVKTELADDDWVYGLDPDAASKDFQIKGENLRAISKTETLTNKTLNSPTTAKPAFVTTLQLPSAKITQVLRGSGSLAPGVLAAETEITVTVTITGLAAGDHVVMNPTAALDDAIVICGYWISAANTLSVRIRNVHATVASAGTAIPVSWFVVRATAPDA